MLIGNIFNVIANEGLSLNDLQKELWVLRRIDDIVSGFLIVLVWYYVMFPISRAVHVLIPLVLHYVLFPLVLHYVLLLLDQ